jgi:hypothetical protein
MLACTLRVLDQQRPIAAEVRQQPVIGDRGDRSGPAWRPVLLELQRQAAITGLPTEREHFAGLQRDDPLIDLPRYVVVHDDAAGRLASAHWCTLTPRHAIGWFARSKTRSLTSPAP